MHIAALAPVRCGLLHVAGRAGGLLEQTAGQCLDRAAQVDQLDDVCLANPKRGILHDAAFPNAGLVAGSRIDCVGRRPARTIIVIAASAPSNAACSYPLVSSLETDIR